MEAAQTVVDPPSFLRATVQRAGHLVLWAPRQAIHHLPTRIQQLVPPQLAHSSVSATPGAPANPPAAPAPPSSSSPHPALALPSPMTYLTSAYLFTALALAFLLHRIHHLVPPRTRTHANSRQSSRVFHPLVQLGCRAPGALLLARTATTLAIAIALNKGSDLAWLSPSPSSTSPFFPSLLRLAVRLLVLSTSWFAGPGAVGRLLSDPSAGASSLDHPALLWSTFLSIAVSLACETFVRALSDDLPSTHHFNLLSFSFLLHVHSVPPGAASSSSSGNKVGGGGSAAMTELYTYLLLTLLEVLTLQASYCLPFVLPSRFSSSASARTPPGRRRARPYRLPITALYSLLAQFFAVRSWIRIFGGLSPSPESGEGAGGRADLEVFSTIWLNKVPEVCFEVVVGVSLGLKVLAAAIRGEEISVDSIVGHPAMAPSREEDYAVALIKYTTHLLSTTRLSGLALELSPLEVLPLSLSAPLTSLGLLEPPLSRADLERLQRQELDRLGGQGTGVVLRANGEVWFDEPIPVEDLVAAQSGHLPSSGGGRRGSVGGGGDPGAGAHEQRRQDGFGHEIRRVTVEDRSNPFPTSHLDVEPSSASPSAFHDPSMVHLEGSRKAVLWRFLVLCARIAVFCAWKAARGVRWVGREAAARTVGWRRDEWALERGWGVSSGEREKRQRRRERGRSRTPGPAQEPVVHVVGETPAWGLSAAELEEDEGEYIPGGEAEEEEEGWTSSEEEEADEQIAEELGAAADEDDSPSALSLYTDLSSPRSSSQLVLPASPSSSGPPDSLTPEHLAPYLLAHHLAPEDGRGMLTRRRFRALLPSSSASPSSPAHDHHHHQSHPHQPSDYALASTSSAISHRRSSVLSSALSAAGGDANPALWMEQRREEWREGRSRFCVVCTVEERSVVLWPCRCLCLCDPCRAALADRTTASSSSGFDGGFDGTGAGAGGPGGGGGGTGGAICPTCRTPVVGFSRIYIP
ncbi:hypothetical protein JCM8097_000037 [Rhodosporidiobolus ruineniae]